MKILRRGISNVYAAAVAALVPTGIAADAALRGAVNVTTSDPPQQADFARALGEHLGATVDELADAEARQSLKRAVESLRDRERTLMPLETGKQELPDALEPMAKLADPDDVLSVSKVARALIGLEDGQDHSPDP